MLFAYLAMLRRKRKKALEARQAEFQQYCDTQNNSVFQSKGVRWTVGTYGAWFTMELDFIARDLAQIGGGAGQMNSFNPSIGMAKPGQGF